MPDLTTLHAEAYPAGHCVARGPGGETLTWSRLLADIAATRQALEAAGAARWALFEPDSYRFAVGLLALLSLGCRVYVPGDNHPATGAALARLGGLSFLGQFRDRAALDIAEAPPGPTTEAPPPLPRNAALQLDEALQLHQGRGEVVVYTSGSSGQPKAIVKHLRQLEAELRMLEARWGESLGQALMAGTVSHQHFYGLLFLVLWPLCRGRPFWRRPFTEAGTLLRSAAATGRFAWVGSPAHLQRLDHALPALVAGPRPALIFSSGGPLEADAAAALRDALGEAPAEVLGSSETGGIAWRQQVPGDDAWTPLPGVQCRCADDGALAVRSATLGHDGWVTTADSAHPLADGRFRLGPRLDRIAKVEGKRIALPAIEQALAANPLVQEACALPLQRRRQSIGAVLVLSGEGHERVLANGPLALFRQLRAALADTLPAAALPRHFRLAAELPRNSQGKLQQTALAALFQPGPAAPVIRRQAEGENAVFSLHIAADNPFLEGHFPGRPVLPGVICLKWAEELARQHFGLGGGIAGLKGVKFQHLIQPGTVVVLELDYRAGNGWLDFRYHSPRARHAQGSIRFGAGA